MEAIVHTSARATIAIAASDARMRQGVFFGYQAAILGSSLPAFGQVWIGRILP